MSDFKKLINGGFFEDAEKLLDPYILSCDEEMDLLSDDELDLLEPHWSALNVADDISSPFNVLNELGLKIPNNSIFIDLGSGHGHPILFFGAKFPNSKFIGYDIVTPKVKYSNKAAQDFGLTNVEFYREDLSVFEIPKADYYFMFNPINIDLFEGVFIKIKGRGAKLIICGDELLDHLEMQKLKKMPLGPDGFYIVNKI